MIVGNMIGGSPSTPKTVMFQTEDGEEMYAVLVGSEQVFTAAANDIREGKVAATDKGVVTGTKKIPAYHTSQGLKVITQGSALSIAGLQDNYDYTELQAIVCLFNTNLSDSVAAEQISVDNKLYNVKSSEVISSVTKNDNDKSIYLGATNEFGTSCIIRYFTYREVP